MHNTSIWRRVSATLIVAVGIAVVWGMVFLWVISLVPTPLRPDDGIRENLIVLVDGTPVIESRSTTRYEDVSYRTLDGKPLPMGTNRRPIVSARLAAPYRPPGLYYPSLGWGQVMSTSDYDRPANGWYLIRNNEQYGRAYLVGYDELSRRPIGYITREGFRRPLPPTGEWFDLGMDDLGWFSGVVASTGYLQYNAKAYHQPAVAAEDHVPPWLLFLIDGDQLLEINLKERSVRPVMKSEGLVSVGVLKEAIGDQTSRDESGNVLRSPTNLQPRVAARTTDRIRVLDPDGGVRQDVPLPELLQEQALEVYSIGGGKLLISLVPKNEPQKLVWLEPDGSISREETVALAGVPQEDPRAAALVIALGVPMPIAWGVAGGILAPISMLQSHQASTYGQALQQLLSIGGPAILLLLLVACVMAGLTWRLQRKYFRPATGVWCAFVFLLGAPGFIAYWLEQRRAKLETCPECDAIVPRDREECARCDALFPAPAPVGTEIFA